MAVPQRGAALWCTPHPWLWALAGPAASALALPDSAPTGGRWCPHFGLCLDFHCETCFFFFKQLLNFFHPFEACEAMVSSIFTSCVRITAVHPQGKPRNSPAPAPVPADAPSVSGPACSGHFTQGKSRPFVSGFSQYGVFQVRSHSPLGQSCIPFYGSVTGPLVERPRFVSPAHQLLYIGVIPPWGCQSPAAENRHPHIFLTAFPVAWGGSWGRTRSVLRSACRTDARPHQGAPSVCQCAPSQQRVCGGSHPVHVVATVTVLPGHGGLCGGVSVLVLCPFLSEILDCARASPQRHMGPSQSGFLF